MENVYEGSKICKKCKRKLDNFAIFRKNAQINIRKELGVSSYATPEAEKWEVIATEKVPVDTNIVSPEQDERPRKRRLAEDTPLRGLSTNNNNTISAIPRRILPKCLFPKEDSLQYASREEGHQATAPPTLVSKQRSLIDCYSRTNINSAMQVRNMFTS